MRLFYAKVAFFQESFTIIISETYNTLKIETKHPALLSLMLLSSYHRMSHEK